MPSQNNSGGQADRQHSITIVAQEPIEPNRFVSFAGVRAHADGGGTEEDGGLYDMQGVSQTAAEEGQALALTTGYSELVECIEAIPFGAYVKPSADDSGRAAVGTIDLHCGIALGETTEEGQKLEVKLCQHVRPVND